LRRSIHLFDLSDVMNKRQFKFSHFSLGDHTVHVMISPNGECWNITRPYSLARPAWNVGDVVEVEMRIARVGDSTEICFVPNWEALGVTRAVKCDLQRPYTSIAEVWGDRYAEQYCRLIAAVGIEQWEREPGSMVSFVADDFVTSEQMSAQEKADVANSFVRFVKSHFGHKHLTTALYVGLMKTFQIERMSPHADLAGRAALFWRTHFKTAEKRQVIIQRIAEGDLNARDYPGLEDLGQAIRGYVVQRALPLVMATHRNAKATRERRQLRALLRKYGIPGDFLLPRQRQ
jgi:hypothetical protein